MLDVERTCFSVYLNCYFEFLLICLGVRVMNAALFNSLSSSQTWVVCSTLELRMRQHGQLRTSLECPNDTIPAGQRCTYWSFCLWLAWTSESWRGLNRVESGEIASKMFRHILEGSVIFASIIYFTEKLSCSQLSSLCRSVFLLAIGSARSVALTVRLGTSVLHVLHCQLKMCHTNPHNQRNCAVPDEKQNLRSWLYEHELDSAKSLDWEFTREHPFAGGLFFSRFQSYNDVAVTAWHFAVVCEQSFEHLQVVFSSWLLMLTIPWSWRRWGVWCEHSWHFRKLRSLLLKPELKLLFPSHRRWPVMTSFIAAQHMLLEATYFIFSEL